MRLRRNWKPSAKLSAPLSSPFYFLSFPPKNMMYTKNGALDAVHDFSNDKNKSEGIDSSSLTDSSVPIVSLVSQDDLKPVLTFLMLADYTGSD